MSKHTLGPWEISRHATPDWHPQYGVYAEGERNDLAIVTGENAEADAKLIAAAPELKQAVEFLLTIIRRNDPKLMGMMEVDYAQDVLAKVES